ncbi:hypothetical protein ACYX7E_15910 [Luteimonas sp. RIT-PG2_3]
MRQVFSSARLENVEAVARMLEAEQIEIRIENGRSFRSAIRGNFSYRDNNAPRPAVWVIRSEDQPRARQLMREAGLLQATSRSESFLPSELQFREPDKADLGRKRGARMRYGLLVVIALIAAAVLVTSNRDEAPAIATAPTTSSTPDPIVTTSAAALLQDAAALPEDRYLLPTPPLLAAMLARRELQAHRDVLCLSIDGQPPGDSVLDALRAGGRDVRDAVACQAENGLAARWLDVHDYLTDGSGTGSIQLATHDGDAAKAVRREHEVRRVGDEWEILAKR